MTLTNEDKARVVEALDTLDEQLRKVIISSMENFARWLQHTLGYIYQKIQDGITAVWAWLKELIE